MKRFNPKLAAALATVAVLSVSVAGIRSVAFAQNQNPPPVSSSPVVTNTQQTDATDQTEQQDAAGAPEVKDANEAVEQSGAPEVKDTNEKPEAGEQAGTEANDTNEAAEPKVDETAEAAALAGKAKITTQQAEAAALAANPGTTVKKTDLGDENGTIIYDVELSNGSDVKVDAQSGAVIGTDAQNANEANEAGEQSK